MRNPLTRLLAVLTLAVLAGCKPASPTVAVPTTPAVAGFDWKSRFPEGLVDADGKAVDFATLGNKVVGVYHSAHWCPPCRAFTPQLVAFANAHRDTFAVVFVSYDRDAAAMAAYMKETQMPWAAVPYKAASGKRNGDENGVRGIPTLLVYGKDGALLTKNGRDLAALEKLLK